MNAPTTHTSPAARQAPPQTVTADTKVRHRSVDVDGVRIFHRETGRRGAPTLLLLHGFPAQSNAKPTRPTQAPAPATTSSARRREV
jgi:hypothetical protein